MRVLVTGARGFIGRHVAFEIERRGHEPVLVSRRADGSDKFMVVGDYGNLPPAPDAALIHLAEAAQIDKVTDETVRRQVASLRTLLSRGYKRAVYVSSGAVYGDDKTYPRRPDEAIAPANAYGRGKAAGEAAARDAGAVVARLANVYGPGMAGNNVVSEILAQLPSRGDVRVRNTASVRDYVWVEDVARGLVDMALGTAEGIFNLGTGLGTSVAELARVILTCAGQAGRSVTATGEPVASTLVLDPSDTLAKFGWRASVALKDGLVRMLGATAR